ncbi:lysophospholipid acyltransferase family protein [Pseudooceanicola sp.]|uniref:lysophospholipid acyltransferase family protein n=1 Tax=Pseudooceanicola sp. TaxID=1914328 RepID=UPI004059C3FF
MSNGQTEPRSLPKRIGDHAINATLLGALGLMRLLPYDTRVRAFGRITSAVIAPLAGWRRRIRANLALAWPDLPAETVERLTRSVPDQIGRTVMEFWSPDEVDTRIRDIALEGPGAPIVTGGMETGRPMILVSGHFSNYAIFRALMRQRYGELGGLYRPMSNAPFNAHYVKMMEANATPLFPRSRRGLAEMVKYVRSGHAVAILHDQHMADGVPLDFFGVKAMTALSPAEMAVKYDAPLIPIYTIRQPDGLSFRIEVEAPIPAGDPAGMMQALNDSLEARIRTHPDQWLWIHRRWRAAQEGTL